MWEIWEEYTDCSPVWSYGTFGSKVIMAHLDQRSIASEESFVMSIMQKKWLCASSSLSSYIILQVNEKYFDLKEGI